MVAITVILAAVIAAFVLELGPGESAPSAQISYEANGSFDDNAAAEMGTLEHDGGDGISLSEVTVLVEDEGGEVERLTESNFGSASDVQINDFDGESTFEVGNSADIETQSSSVFTGDYYEITIIHEPSDSILFEEQVYFN